jgi:hypothetical protein
LVGAAQRSRVPGPAGDITESASMSIASCVRCSHQWNASLSPLCARCECKRLIAAPNLISDKHDPRLLPSVGSSYRSCLSHDFVANTDRFVEYAAGRGSWFYSTVHDTWNYFTPQPLGRLPGSGIHAGDPMPDHTLDGLMFADALSDPHAYAVDEIRIHQQVHDGELVPLSECPRRDCGNLCVPGASACALHSVPPLAHPVE